MIRDVAREAGVSVATVSRVCNGSHLVTEATRRHVQDVCTRLGYVPHGAARALITSKTRMLGILLPDLHGEFFSEVLRGIDQAAQRRGYHVLVASSHDEPRELVAALGSMHGRVDGLVVMSPSLDGTQALATLNARFPVVLLNCRVAGDAFETITIENAAGAAAVVRHLLQLGHRRIATLTGSPTNYDSAERLRGFRDALLGAGITPDPDLEVMGGFRESGGYNGALALLDMEVRPTAIFAANDAMAIGALGALHERGLRVPSEMAVVGFDDIPMARFITPPLTSVHVDISELGERATVRLLDGLEHPGARERRHDIIPTRLVIRGSCGGQGRATSAPGALSS
ncbi:MAG: LacI family DNA-binding transcriptional regulator [Gemmatimonadaceae bacterium]